MKDTDISSLISGFGKIQKEMKDKQHEQKSHWKNTFFPGTEMNSPIDYFEAIRNSLMRMAIAFDLSLVEDSRIFSSISSRKDYVNDILSKLKGFSRLYKGHFDILTSPKAVVFIAPYLTTKEANDYCVTIMTVDNNIDELFNIF
jgi:hypothetical protein